MKYDFRVDLLRATKQQMAKYPYYKDFCEKAKGVCMDDIEDQIESYDLVNYSKIAIPSGGFKAKSSDGAFVEFFNKKITGRKMASSGTTEDNTIVNLSEQDIVSSVKLYKSAYDAVPDSDIGIWFTPDEQTQRMFLRNKAIDNSPLEPYSLIGTWAANEKVQSPNFVVQFSHETKSLGFDREKFQILIQDIISKDQTAIFGGFILLMYYPLLELSKQGADLSNVRIITGGGGRNTGKKGKIDIGKKIGDKGFYELLSSLGIIHEVDVYATTEGLGPWAGKYDQKEEKYIYTVPEEAILLVLDIETNEPVKEGEAGTPVGIQLYKNADNEPFEGYAGLNVKLLADLIKVESYRKLGKAKVVEHFSDIDRIPAAGEGGCGLPR